MISRAWQALASTDPALPWVLLPVLVWLATWAVRRAAPEAWERFAALGPGGLTGKAWQALPPTVIGSVLTADAVGLQPRDLALAAVVSVLAPVWHEALRYVTARIPALPTYTGAPDQTKGPDHGATHA